MADDQRGNTASDERFRRIALVTVLVAEALVAVLMLLHVFYPLVNGSKTEYTINAVFFTPLIAFAGMLVANRMIVRGLWPRMAWAIVGAGLIASVYSCYALVVFDLTWLRGVVLGYTWLAVPGGIMFGFIVYRWARLKGWLKGAAPALQTAFVLCTLSIMVSFGHAFQLMPTLVTSRFRTHMFPRRDILEMVNAPGPSMPMQALDGTTYTLAKDRGKVVLMNFWATWCRPCIEEMPLLEKFFADRDSAQVSFISVSVDTDTSRVRRYIDTTGYTFPVVFGGDELFYDFGVRAIPRNIVLDREGRIRYVTKGFNGEESIGELETAVSALLSVQQ